MFVVALQVGWSVEGLQRMERHGRLHLPTVFQMQLEQYDNAGADCLQQVHRSTTPHIWSYQREETYDGVIGKKAHDWLTHHAK